MYELLEGLWSMFIAFILQSGPETYRKIKRKKQKFISSLNSHWSKGGITFLRGGGYLYVCITNFFRYPLLTVVKKTAPLKKNCGPLPLWPHEKNLVLPLTQWKKTDFPLTLPKKKLWAPFLITYDSFLTAPIAIRLQSPWSRDNTLSCGTRNSFHALFL